MSIKVSVIIPVYNAEKYITHCIESLINQTLNECEFIFVNDGSTDSSSNFIKKYKKLDNRIKLIEQKNQGVSTARNAGLNVAEGEYIGFVDADDFVEKNMYERLFNSAKQDNCDVTISNYQSELEGCIIITKYPFPSDEVLNKAFIKSQLFPYILQEDNLNTVVNKIYKKDLIEINNIRFLENIVLGEDRSFNLEFFSMAKTVKYINYTGYFYREVIGSATRNIAEKDYFKTALEVFTSELSEKLTEGIGRNKIYHLKSIRLIKSVMSYIYIYFSPSKEISFRKRYEYVKKMINNKHVREALLIFYKDKYKNLGRYEKLLIDLINRKFTFGLFLATTYSRFRNYNGGTQK